MSGPAGRALDPAAWPSLLMGKLAMSAHRGVDNLARLYQNPHVWVSLYSGWDAPKEGWRVWQGHWETHFGTTVRALWASSCDFGALQQRVLLDIARAEGSGACVFANILHRIDESVQRLVLPLFPVKAGGSGVDSVWQGSSPEEVRFQFCRVWIRRLGPRGLTAPWPGARATSAQSLCPGRGPQQGRVGNGSWQDEPEHARREKVMQLRDIVDMSKSWAVGRGQHAACLAHGRLCPCHPLEAIDAFPKVDPALGLFPNVGKKPRVSHAMPWYMTRKAHDLVGSGNEDAPQPKPFSWSIAGACCQDHSVVGGRQGDLGEHEPPHVIWCAERVQLALQLLEDGYFFECTPCYPVETKQVEAFAATHKVIHVTWSPHRGIFKTRRPRLFASGLNLQTLVYTGPEGDCLQQAFDEFMDKDVCSNELDGNIYLRASDREVIEMTRQLARRKALPQEWEKDALHNYRSLLPYISPPGISCRLSEWDIFNSNNEPILADLSHHPGKGPNADTNYPTLLTNHQLWSYKANRFTTPLEDLAAMGVDAYECLSGGRPVSPLVDVWARLSLREAAVLTGNAMHVPSILAWIVFVQSFCVPRAVLEQLAPALCARPFVEDDMDDDTFPGECLG